MSDTVYEHDLPPRSRMEHISDLLSIPQFTTSRGGSVRRDFLEAVGLRIGIPSPAAYGNKDDLLDAICLLLIARPSMHKSKGGTVTNEALDEILRGLELNGFSGPAGNAAKLQVAVLEEEESYQEGDDSRRRRLLQTYVRDRQGVFRNRLLIAYRGRCAVTGVRMPEVLEAAHIRPYRGAASSVTSNGILLRSDVHALWDSYLIAVEPSTFRLLIHERLTSSAYAGFAGRPLRLPDGVHDRPDTRLLAAHLEECEFGSGVPTPSAGA